MTSAARSELYVATVVQLPLLPALYNGCVKERVTGKVIWSCVHHHGERGRPGAVTAQACAERKLSKLLRCGKETLMRKPDWSDTTSRSLPLKGWAPSMVRMFPRPDGLSRIVSVESVRFAVHTHVELVPEPNPVWGPGGWTTFGDDSDASRERRHDTFESPARALRWVARTLERLFPAPAWTPVFAPHWRSAFPRGWTPDSVKPDDLEDAAVEQCPICKHAVGGGIHGAPDRQGDCERYIAKFGPPALARTLVNAGSVFGTVGVDILVVHMMRPEYVPELVGKRALVAAVGGATNHLAQVAAGRNVTVMLVPDAVERFPKGTALVIDPKAGTVEVA